MGDEVKVISTEYAWDMSVATAKTNPERRVRVVYVREDLIVSLLNAGRAGGPGVIAVPDFPELPEGFVVERARHCWDVRAFALIISHPSFEVVPDGTPAPVWPGLRESAMRTVRVSAPGDIAPNTMTFDVSGMSDFEQQAIQDAVLTLKNSTTPKLVIPKNGPSVYTPEGRREIAKLCYDMARKFSGDANDSDGEAIELSTIGTDPVKLHHFWSNGTPANPVIKQTIRSVINSSPFASDDPQWELTLAPEDIEAMRSSSEMKDYPLNMISGYAFIGSIYGVKVCVDPERRPGMPKLSRGSWAQCVNCL